MVVIGVHVNLKIRIHSRPLGFISVSNLVYTLNCGRWLILWPRQGLLFSEVRYI